MHVSISDIHNELSWDEVSRAATVILVLFMRYLGVRVSLHDHGDEGRGDVHSRVELPEQALGGEVRAPPYRVLIESVKEFCQVGEEACMKAGRVA